MVKDDTKEEIIPIQSTTEVNSSINEGVVPFAVVAVKPKFQDGDAKKFPTWAQTHVKYPDEAINKKIEGTVYVQFTIGVDGNLENIKILRSIDPSLDDEVIRVVQSSPKWTPGKDKNGKVVAVSYQFPFAYKLKNE